ncbi:unnamed protein product, partial [Strongylus vulgaris]
FAPSLEGVFLDVPHTHLVVDRNGATRKRLRNDDHLKVKLLKALQILIRRQESEDASERAAGEWRQVAQSDSATSIKANQWWLNEAAVGL